MSPITYSLAFFLGVFLETLLVGLFIPLLVLASYAQWKKVSKGKRMNAIMIFTTVFLGLSIPAHWILGMRRVIVAALYTPSGMTIDQYLEPPYRPDEVARFGIFQFQLVVGDLVMIYRLYHIYNRSFLACVIPSMTTSGLIAIGGGLMHQLPNLSTPADIKAYNGWVTSCFCVTLFNSAFLCASISYRLWAVHRETSVSGASLQSQSVVFRAMKVMVESAALWTFFVFMNFVTFLANSNLSYTFLDMTNPAVGISFCLIIVRLGSVTPEVCDDSWESSRPSRVSRSVPTPHGVAISGLSLPLDRVKVEQDIYVTESGSTIEFRVVDPKSPGSGKEPAAI